MNHKKKGIIALALISTILFGAESCETEDAAPEVESDSSSSYKAGSKVPVDDEVYTIRGEVIGEVNETSRQIKPAEGELNGYIFPGTYGSITGSFTGPVEAGKGFVRIRVESASPTTDLAPTGDVTIIKTSDTKVKALLNGDIVEFKCRRQYEAIAAVRDNSSFDSDKVATWELDYCRLSAPVITVKDAPKLEQ